MAQSKLCFYMIFPLFHSFSFRQFAIGYKLGHTKTCTYKKCEIPGNDAANTKLTMASVYDVQKMMNKSCSSLLLK